jgi:1-acyl-sn-glycerol-3-phosphate acyltransferase
MSVDWSRRAVGRLARAVTWLFYRVERVGRAPDGPIILLPNHPNALLDPAVVWATSGRDVRFLAKEPLFRMPVISWIVRGAGSIPVQRKVDAGADMAKNRLMFGAAEAALASGDAICIFPEGASHSSGRVEPLRTGAARLALRAVAGGTSVRVVPVGLNFDRKSTFRSRAVVVYGEPMEVRPAGTSENPDPPDAVRQLTDRMTEALRRLVIEVDPLTDARLVARIDQLYCAARPEVVTADRVQRRRIIAAGIERLRREQPDWYAAMRQRLDAYDARRRRFALRERDVDARVPASSAARFAVRETALAVPLVPLAAAALLLFAVPYFVTGWIAALATRDLDVRATFKVVGGALVYAFWTGIVLWAAWRTLEWPAALAGVALVPAIGVAGLFAIEREWSVARTVRAYAAVRRTPARAHARLRSSRAEIAAVIEQAYRWLQEDAVSAREPSSPQAARMPR